MNLAATTAKQRLDKEDIGRAFHQFLFLINYTTQRQESSLNL